MPGCDVKSAFAVSVRLRLRRTASCTKRNWCRFIVRGAPAAARGHAGQRTDDVGVLGRLLGVQRERDGASAPPAEAPHQLR